jgi:hypothetical protein
LAAKAPTLFQLFDQKNDRYQNIGQTVINSHGASSDELILAKLLLGFISSFLTEGENKIERLSLAIF